jgi:hypothetical protein
MEIVMRLNLFFIVFILLLIIKSSALGSSIYLNSAASLLLHSNKGQDIPIYYSRSVEDLAQKALSYNPSSETALRFMSLLLIADRKDDSAPRILWDWSISDELLRRRGLHILKIIEKRKASSICEDVEFKKQIEDTDKEYLASLGAVGVRYLEAAGSLEYPYFSSLLDLMDFYRSLGISNDMDELVDEMEGRLVVLENRDKKLYEDAIQKRHYREKVVQNILWGTYWSMEQDRQGKDWDSVISKSKKILSIDSQFPFVELSLAEAFYYSGDCTNAEPLLRKEFSKNNMSIALDYLMQCDLQSYGHYSPNGISESTKNINSDDCNIKWTWDRLVIWNPILNQSLKDLEN